MTPTAIEPEIRDLLDRWVSAVEEKDLDALAAIFRSGSDLVVFWSNGERTVGWDEVRRHVEIDFRKEGIDFSMDIADVALTSLDADTRVLTYRYTITLSLGGDSAALKRLASMTVHRDPDGWRVAALHISNEPGDEAAPN